MTTREQLAGMAMAGLLSNPNVIQVITSGIDSQLQEFLNIEEFARMKADDLMDELARTAENSSLVEPDADGWIKHDPSGPVPADWSLVRFADGEALGNRPSAGWPECYWNHTNGPIRTHITHYKP